jgi:hypothetical protein
VKVTLRDRRNQCVKMRTIIKVREIVRVKVSSREREREREDKIIIYYLLVSYYLSSVSRILNSD